MASISNTSNAAEIIQDALDRLFDSESPVTDLASLQDRMEAFENLAVSFARESSAAGSEGPKWDILDDDLVFDAYGVRAMVGRFYRDAFGVRQFQKVLAQNVPNQSERDRIWSEFKATSLRINTTNPRKTRIAATFSLWLATFRPVSLSPKKSLPPHLATEFCARLNLYIATAYLRQYGTVLLDEPGESKADEENRAKIMERIFHDFTFRELRLSALEMLYCGIFRAKVAA